MGFLSISTRLLKTSEGVEQWLQHGKEALVSKHGERAEWAFGNILEAQAETPEALQGLLTAWLLQGKSDQVIEYHDASSEHVQDQLREYLWIALAMQVGHLTPDGYAKWICLASQHPERLAGLQELSEAFAKCGALSMDWANAALGAYRLDIAQKALKQLRDAQPRIPEREVARLHARRDAVVLREHPEISALLNEACQISSPLERFDRLEPVARRNMDIAALQREAGLALFEANRPEEAMRYLNRAVDINPYWLNAWIELGFAAKAAKRLIRTKESFTRAHHLSREPWLLTMQTQLEQIIEENPHLPPYEIACDRMKVGDFPGAVLPLKKAIKETDEPVARWALGEVYFAQGNYKRASSYLRSVWADSLEQNEQLTPTQLSQIELCTHQHTVQMMADGHVEDALDLLDEMLSAGEHFDLLREDQWIGRRLVQEEISPQAFLLYERGRPLPSTPLKESLALIDAAVQDSNHFPEALVARAVVAAELGDLEAAARDLKFALGALEATGTGVFHMAGLAFLRQDIAMARALWQRSANEGLFPWAQRSQANLNALETQRTQDLYIAWLPTHQRIIEFTPSASLSLDDLPAPAPEAVVFEILPSVELDAVDLTLDAEQVRSLAQDEVPRFSDLIPDEAKAAPNLSTDLSDPLAFLTQDIPQSPPRDENANEDFFGVAKESELPSFLLDEDAAEGVEEKGWDLGEEQVDDLLPEAAATSKEQVPLFNITDKQDLDAEYPLDLVQAQGVQIVPKLSDVVPDQGQGLEDFSATNSLMDDGPAENVGGFVQTAPPQNENPLAALPTFQENPLMGDSPLVGDNPLLGDNPLIGDNPFVSNDLLPQESAAPSPVQDSSAELTSSLFGGEDDLSSFLDEAFLSLDNIEEK